MKRYSELQREPGWLKVEKNDLYDAARRFQPLDVELLLLIACRTTSDTSRAEYANIDMDEWRQYTGMSERAIALSLARLEKPGAVQRQFPHSQTRRGGYKIDWQKVRTAPVRGTRTRQCRPRNEATEAEVRAPRAAAARSGFSTTSQDILHNIAESFTVSSPFTGPPITPPILHSNAESTERFEQLDRCAELQNTLHLDAGSSATYCSVGLVCPYFLKAEALSNKNPSGGRAETSEAVCVPEAAPKEPPARPLESVEPETPPEPPAAPSWQAELREWMLKDEHCPVKSHLDPAIFREIVAPLNAELVPRFQALALEARGRPHPPRKWKYYVPIAHDAAQRGPLTMTAASAAATPPGKVDLTELYRGYREREEQRRLAREKR